MRDARVSCCIDVEDMIASKQASSDLIFFNIKSLFKHFFEYPPIIFGILPNTNFLFPGSSLSGE